MAVTASQWVGATLGPGPYCATQELGEAGMVAVEPPRDRASRERVSVADLKRETVRYGFALSAFSILACVIG